MSLITDNDIRKVMNIKVNKGKSVINFTKNLLGFDRINRIYNENKTLSGPEFVDAVIKNLSISFSVSEDIRKKIPESGPFILIANHPLGGLDGLLLIKLICEIRPDFKLQGNYLLHHIEPIKNYIIPVNPFENYKAARSSYKGIKGSFRHLSEGKPLGIFPAGEVSSYIIEEMKITDRQWQKSSIRFIQEAGVPVIPVFFNGYNSAMFYLLGQVHPFLRTVRLPLELLRRRRKSIQIHIGQPIPYKTIKSFSSTKSLSCFLRAKTYSYENNITIENFFKSLKTRKDNIERIPDAIDPSEILIELNNLPREDFLFTMGNFTVFCSSFYSIPIIIKEIGRLREITFREVGEGSNKSLDIDNFDIHYNHLIIWDNLNKKIVGCYRIGKGKDIIYQYGKQGFYINTLFKINKKMIPVLKKSMELGRSFIVKEYQKQPLALMMLWKGILVYLKRNPDYEYLIGPVSISNNFSKQSKSLIVQFIMENYYNYQLAEYIKPRKEFRISGKLLQKNKEILEGIDNDIKVLDLCISSFQPDLTIPVLLKKYLKMNGKIIGFNIDPDFNDCLDGLILVNANDIPEEIVGFLSRELKTQKAGLVDNVTLS